MSSSNIVLFVTIKICENVKDTITVRDDEEPIILAKKFCGKHKLSKKCEVAITKMIDKELDLIVEETLQFVPRIKKHKIIHKRQSSAESLILSQKLNPKHQSHKSLQIFYDQNKAQTKITSPKSVNFKEPSNFEEKIENKLPCSGTPKSILKKNTSIANYKKLIESSLHPCPKIIIKKYQ